VWKKKEHAAVPQDITSTGQSTCMQAPIPMSQLLNDDGRAPTGFIPFLRDALVSVLFATHSGTSTVSQKLTVRREIARSFKLLAGKLLEQLHARAARVAAISDTVFHAHYLQHAHFHRGVRCFTTSLLQRNASMSAIEACTPPFAHTPQAAFPCTIGKAA
jgi:hypothetical protein